MVSLRSVASLALVFAMLAACRIGADPATDGARGGPGALCGSNDECENGYCRPQGYCGKNGCGGDDDCPTGWTCESSRGDPIFGSGGGTYCEPSCGACPAGTGCERSHECRTLEPIVTVKGGPARVGQPTTLELGIDARGLPLSEVTWQFETFLGEPEPTPASGSGTKVSVTFNTNRRHGLVVTLGGPGTTKTTSTRLEIDVCGEAGAVCSGAEGECCGGECALRRNIAASFDARTTTCVLRCPATCAPGHSCRAFDRFDDGSLPTGAFCLPDVPVITIDYAPKNPTIDQAVTFTSSVTSPAGLKIVGYRWLIGDSQLDSGNEPTMTRTFARSGTYEVALEVSDDAGQRAKKTVTIASCTPAGQSCFFGGPCCAGSICSANTCQ